MEVDTVSVFYIQKYESNLNLIFVLVVLHYMF
jgi:hypothetical protein